MHITIIDDEKILSEKIAKKVRNNGFSASSFLWYEDFMKNGDSTSQLYIIDSSLRDGNGIDIVHWLRGERGSMAPIIMISGHDNAQNKINWLNSGADDYIVKPFLPDELMARIHAVLRRPHNIEDTGILSHKSIRFDKKSREVFVHNSKIHLTKTEQILLETFLENIGTVVSKEKIVANVWWSHKYTDISDNTICAHVSNIRKKLGDDFFICPEYSNWYMLRA